MVAPTGRPPSLGSPGGAARQEAAHMADDSLSATAIIHAPAKVVFAVLADPTKHAAIDWNRLGLRTRRPQAVDRGRAGFPDGHVPPEPSGRALPGGQPCRGVRPAQRHLVEAGHGNRGRQPDLRRLGVALRPDAGWTVCDQGHALLRLVWGSRTSCGNASASRHSRRTTWATRSPISLSSSPCDQSQRPQIFWSPKVPIGRVV
jgi:hypothetical protein